MDKLLSPKQVAVAIGASESSLKRWCDQGLIETVRTAGGHRRLSVSSVLGYLQKTGHQLIAPEILGLPPLTAGAGQRSMAKARGALLDALTQCHDTAARQIVIEAFTAGQLVDIRGTTIGKGYAGTIKRHHFAGQDATHGNSVSHRVPGSIGQRQTPGRVFKGKRMSGHLGNVGRSIMNLAVVRVDAERNLLLVKGAVPGHAGSHVVVKPAAKIRRKKKG